MTLIAPSLLSADFANIANEVRALEAAGADMLHLDVMDGNFVQQITFGALFIKAVKSVSTLPLDVHLMIKNPEISIASYIEAGADIITFHPEAVSKSSTMNLINVIKKHNKKVGIACNPYRDFIQYAPYLGIVDRFLVMTVVPGAAGQEFISDQLILIDKLKKAINDRGDHALISVDGGINNETAKLCLARGADILVSGSYIFAGDYKQRISSLLPCLE
jgi:ribulose-phosphate 3-epimerase